MNLGHTVTKKDKHHNKIISIFASEKNKLLTILSKALSKCQSPVYHLDQWLHSMVNCGCVWLAFTYLKILPIIHLRLLCTTKTSVL